MDAFAGDLGLDRQLGDVDNGLAVGKSGENVLEEIKGYYSGRKAALLKDFRHTLSIMESSLAEKYGEKRAHSLQSRAIKEHEKLIPDIPYFKGYRQRTFNRMLLITSQIVGAYRVLEEEHQPLDQIWMLCHEALELRLKEVPLWKRQLIKLFWHTLMSRMVKRRGRRSFRETICLFGLEYIDGDGTDYDFGVNYTACGHHEFLKRQNAEAIFPYICLADIALSDAFGWGLTRTQTLGDGADHCDFRFRRGSVTEISSRTPDVQEVIDKITSSYRPED